MSKQKKDKSISEPSELDHRIKKADPMIREAISEYKKEIARLQKKLVKEQISHESEKAHLLEQIKQNKTATPTVIINGLEKKS